METSEQNYDVICFKTICCASAAAKYLDANDVTVKLLLSSVWFIGVHKFYSTSTTVGFQDYCSCFPKLFILKFWTSCYPGGS